MSYQIIYNKAFIKVDNDRVIPFLEAGSNNCYEWSGRGSKRARNWSNDRSFTDGQMVTKNDALLSNLDKTNKKLKEEMRNEEYSESSFGYFASVSLYGKKCATTSFKAFKNIYVKGIEQAKTIEKWVELEVRFKLSVYYYEPSQITNKGKEILPDVIFTSTQQMLETIEKYESYYGRDFIVYISLVDNYSMERYFAKLKREKPKLIFKEKIPLKNYFLIKKKDESLYFVRRSVNRLRLTFSPTLGKQFPTEKSAQTYIDKHLSGAFVVSQSEVV